MCAVVIKGKYKFFRCLKISSFSSSRVTRGSEFSGDLLVDDARLAASFGFQPLARGRKICRHFPVVPPPLHLIDAQRTLTHKSPPGG